MSTPGAKPKFGNITKFFLPGLVIGLTVGALGGAFYAPRVEQELTPTTSLSKPIERSKPVPQEPKAQEPKAAPTGQSGASGEVHPTGEAPK